MLLTVADGVTLLITLGGVTLLLSVVTPVGVLALLAKRMKWWTPSRGPVVAVTLHRDARSCAGMMRREEKLVGDSEITERGV